jgi:hypothetical protein
LRAIKLSDRITDALASDDAARRAAYAEKLRNCRLASTTHS